MRLADDSPIRNKPDTLLNKFPAVKQRYTPKSGGWARCAAAAPPSRRPTAPDSTELAGEIVATDLGERE